MATTKASRKPRPAKVYPLEIRSWASGGWYSYGHHDFQHFIDALSAHLDENIACIEGFIHEYGYHVPAAKYSEYRTMWYTCDGPQRGARPITMCYEVGIQTSDGVRYICNDRE